MQNKAILVNQTISIRTGKVPVDDTSLAVPVSKWSISTSGSPLRILV
jgi:hypothetical protein